jgi:hypothetical protein
MDQNHLNSRGIPLKGNTGHSSRNKPSTGITANQLFQNHRSLLRDGGKDWGITGGTGDHKPLALNSLEEILTLWIP